jgi:hypothetical protein
MKRKHLVQVWAVLALLASLAIGVGGASSAMDELAAEAAAGTVASAALSTSFTYQGLLRDGSGPVNATCDLQFKLWDAASGGAQVGDTILLEDVLLADGLFTARLDFGAAAFRGQARYLEVAASCPVGSAFVPLPRQELTASPYALWALGAPWSGLEGVPADLLDGDQDTTYTTGAGLVLEGTEFRVNRGEVQWRVSQTCAAGNSIRAIDVDGTVTCEADDNTTYTPGTGLSLVGGQFSVNFGGSGTASTASRSDHNHDAAYVNEGQANSVSTGMVQNSTLLLEDLNQNGCSAGQIIKWNGSAWACAADSTGATSFWSLTGNGGTVPGTNYLGTSDNVALEIKVNGARVLRLEPGSSPNLLGGYSGNLLTAQVVGATIGGGGSAGYANRVTDSWGTVGGGANNRAGDDAGTVSDASYATVGGGLGNTAQRESATIGGGAYNNVLGVYGTVAGGDHNHAYGQNSAVAGGGWNEVIGSGSYASIGGGYENSATQPYATIAGGSYNTASGQYATVGGGQENSATGSRAAVSGGYDNTASGSYATVGGGDSNTAASSWATIGGGSDNEITVGYANTIGGGWSNRIDGAYATIAGGSFNIASGENATIGGGGAANALFSNHATGDFSTVSGGLSNFATAAFATIGGGGCTVSTDPDSGNLVSDDFGTVGGGGNNQAGDNAGNTSDRPYATVGGGSNNTASGSWAAVGGGFSNTASGTAATVGGGSENLASHNLATVGGGDYNTASGLEATVGGGFSNLAQGYAATIGGGYNSTASGQNSTVGGGTYNIASGPNATVGGGWTNTASGNAATVPGGAENVASGGYSFAAGAQANASHDGSFVWSSATATDSWGANTFTVRSHGGARFYSAVGTGTGVQLSAGGTSFGSISDRNAKEAFAPVDTDRLLEVLAGMPVQTWNLKSQVPEVRHIGPVAQDFNGSFAYLFGEVESPIHINNMDAVGVSLAASQGLYELSQEQAMEIAGLQAENAALQEQIGDLESRLAVLEAGQGADPSPARLPSGWLLLGGGVVAVGAVVGRRAWGGGR